MVDSWSTVWLRLRTDSKQVKEDIEKGARDADTTTAGRTSGNRFTKAFSDAWAAGQKDNNTKFTKSSGDAGKQAGQAAGRSFATEFGKLIGDINLGGGGGRQGLFKGIAGGAGPNILGLNFLSKAGGIAGAAGLGLGALPALAGGGLAAGVAAGGAGALAGTFGIVQSQVTPARQAVTQAQAAVASATTPAQAQAAQAKLAAANAEVAKLSPALQQIIKSEDQIQKTWTTFAKSLAPLMVGPIKQVAALLPQLTGPLHQMFAGAATLAKPLIDGLGNLAKQVLPLLGQAFKAVAPLIAPLIKGLTGLLTGLLPGIIALLKAAQPAVAVLAKFLADLGGAVGGLFAKFAPVIDASSKVLGALLDVVVALLPIIGQLATIFANALGPVIGAFAGVIKALLPILVVVGKVIAELASAVIVDLVAAFNAIVGLFKVIAPALTIFLHALSGVFLVLENSGVFGILASALESIVKPLGLLISAILTGLAPILPPVIQFIGQLSALLAAQLAKAIVDLLPPLTQLATVVLQAIAQMLPVILPLLVQFWSGFSGATVAAIGGIAKALSAIITAIPVPVLKAITDGIIAIWAATNLFSAAKSGVELVSKGFKALKDMCILTRIQLVLLEAKTIAVKVAQVAVAAATKVWAAMQWLLNAAMDANPIGLIIIGLAALAAGIYLAWTHSATFRKILIAVWHDILVAVQAVISWFSGSFVNFFAQTLPHVWANVVTFAKGLWTGIAGAFVAGWNWVWAHTLGLMLTFFTKTVPHWWDLLVATQVRGWTRIGAAFVAGWNWLWGHTVVPMQTFFLKTIPHWWDLVWASVKWAWTRWGDLFRDGWNWIVQHTLTPMQTLFTKTLPGWFDTAVRAVKAAWDKIQETVRKPIKWVINNVIDKLIGIINKVLGFVHLGQIGTITMAAGGARITKGSHETADDVLALVSRNETIVSAKHSRILAPAFAAVGVPGYAGGGVPNLHSGAGLPGGGGVAADLGTGIGPSRALMEAWFGPVADPSHETNVNFAGRTIGVNKFVATTVAVIGNAIAQAYPGYVDASTGGFRTSIGASTSNIPYSMHQLGLAIDVNPDTNPYLGNTGSILSHPKIIDIFANHGWFWGGNWGPGGRDQMHFQLQKTTGQRAGFFGKIGAFFGGIVRTLADIFGGLGDAAKVAIDLAHGDEGAAGRAMASLLGKFGLAGAAGPFGDMLTHLPPELIKKAMHFMVSGVKSFAASQQGGSPGAVPPLSGSAAAAQAFAQAHLAQFGWGMSQWPPLRDLWQGESGWNANAVNASSGAAGIPQALGHGHVFNLGDYANQVLWGMNYIKTNPSYGTPAVAYSKWLSRSPHWYGNGGWINEPVVGLGRYSRALYSFGEAGREYVTPEAQMGAPEPGGAAPLIGSYHTNYYGIGDTAEAMRELTFTLRRAKQGAFYPAGS